MKKVLFQVLIIQALVLVTFFGCKKEEKEPVLPSLITNDITAITTNSANTGGTISSNGGAAITMRGVCWSNTQEPTINDNKTTDNSNSDNFSSSITGLNAGTLYYVRAYATNSAGTSYGNTLSLTTLGQVPAALTQAITNISTNTATFNGQVNANHLNTVVSFEYGLTTDYGQTISATQSPITGNAPVNVSVEVTGLKAGNIYHVRVKTVNSLGTIYGSDQTFQTIGNAPTVITLNATSVLGNSATLNGNVNPNYLSTVVTFEYGLTTDYGQVVAASQSPLTGSIASNVSANITGLKANTTYHFRSKSVNEAGTTYSNDWTFKTIGQPPHAFSQPATAVSLNTATVNGGVIPNYLSTNVVFEYGLTASYGQEISATQSPITGNINTVLVSTDISGLTPNTTYHFRVKATNELGTVYSTDRTFTTYYGTITDIEGNVYKTIKIGSQIWMAENLRTGTLNDGSAIPLTSANLDWENINNPGFCWYGNDAATYKTTNGALYNWFAVNTGKLAPTGWHVPTDAEWKTLVDYLGGSSVAGGKMKDNYNIETGFSALISGQRSNNGTFGYLGVIGTWWSSSAVYSNGGLIQVNVNDTQTFSGSTYKASGFSVRCLKD